jgi:deoxyribonuclease V
MILAFDTYYFGDQAKTVCLAFDHWGAEKEVAHWSEVRGGIADYEPGAFYKRELPCILSLLGQVRPAAPECLVVDGYVFLDDQYQLGLGGHLYQAMGEAIPVIGVAKTNFATVSQAKLPLLRGQSTRQLYITAVGVPLDVAAGHIGQMAGAHRLPTLLKKLDMLTRQTD